MLYLERRPVGPLQCAVQSLWYVRRPAPATAWEQVLPNGRAQIVINLAHDHCTGRSPGGEPIAQAPVLAVGVQHRALSICTRDTEEMVGVVFAPWGLARLLRQSAAPLAGCETAVDAVVRPALAATLRDRLRETARPEAKLQLLELILTGQWRRTASRGEHPHPAVCLALEALQRCEGRGPVAPLARLGGVSERRLRDLFRDQIGVGPKLYARILRFRGAMERLHRGEDLRWAELALECGFADQSHFANEFHAFSGVDPTTYTRSLRPWAAHLAIQP